MAGIVGIGTAAPRFHYNSTVIGEAVAERWLVRATERDRFARFVESSLIAKRHFVQPLEEILDNQPEDERTRVYEREALTLLNDAFAQAMRSASVSLESIDTIVTTSCTCPVLPAIDTLFISENGLNPSVRRIPIYQYGCGGGVAGLRLAADLAGKGRNTLFLAVEVCSLLFRPKDRSPASLIGSALFADGAGAVILGNEESSWNVVNGCSFVVPSSRDLLGYSVQDGGAHLRLDKKLPQLLREHVPAFVARFLAQNELLPSEVGAWILHPGGRKILEELEAGLSLSRTQTEWSWKIIEEYGNLSSASVLFVLQEWLKSGGEPFKDNMGKDYAVLISIGPGVTVELVLLKRPK